MFCLYFSDNSCRLGQFLFRVECLSQTLVFLLCKLYVAQFMRLCSDEFTEHSSYWCVPHRGAGSLSLAVWCLWLKLEHLKHLLATNQSSTLHIIHPSLTFYCRRSFQFWALTYTTRFRVCFFVTKQTIALQSPSFR
jgi:hypothetical protein